MRAPVTRAHAMPPRPRRPRRLLPRLLQVVGPPAAGLPTRAARAIRTSWLWLVRLPLMRWLLRRRAPRANPSPNPNPHPNPSPSPNPNPNPNPNPSPTLTPNP
eukprot:scaffold14320_cov42-Phaeocystis_antarctica.AAC.2